MRLAQRLRGELVGQVKTSDRRLGGQLNWPIRIEALHDARLRWRSVGRMFRDLGNHPVATAHPACGYVAVRDRTVELQAAIRRGNPSAASVDLNGAQECADRAPDDFFNGS